MASGTTNSRFGERVMGVESEVSLLDWAVTCLSVLLVLGVVWDGIGHANGRSFAEEGFFVPSHVFFYSMFLGIVAAVFVSTYRNRRQGKTWVAAVPEGYGYGVVGLGIFGAAGVADYFWHRTFGFEQGFEVLVSPSHLMLAVGATLFLTMPLRSAWVREGRIGGFATVPVVVSTALAMTIVTLFGGFLVPLTDPYPATFARMSGVVAKLVAYPLLLVGLALALVRRFDLPPLSFTLVFGVSASGIVLIGGYPPLVLPAVAAGVVADAVVLVRPPRPSDARALRTFSVAVPATFVVSYFAVVEWQYGIVHRSLESGFRTWSPHVLGGSVLLAGLAGLLLSYLVAPGIAGEGSA